MTGGLTVRLSAELPERTVFSDPDQARLPPHRHGFHLKSASLILKSIDFNQISKQNEAAAGNGERDGQLRSVSHTASTACSFKIKAHTHSGWGFTSEEIDQKKIQFSQCEGIIIF